MSKIVTIPTGGGNPFVVILGGVKYVYKPGETVEVPDGVALEIEEWERWKDKYHGAVQPPFGAGGGGADWNQNDPNAPDYVKNRTHWVEENESLDIDFGERYAQTFVDGDTYLNRYHEGEVLGVEINGVKYYCELKYANFESGELYVGNQSLGDYEFSESVVSDEPFLIYFGVSSTDFYTNIEADKYKWTIYLRYKDYHTLDIGYIPYEILDNMPLCYMVMNFGAGFGLLGGPTFYEIDEGVRSGSRPLVIRVLDNANSTVYDGMFVKVDFSNADDEGVIRIHFMYGDNPNSLKSLTITLSSNEEDYPIVS